MRVRYSNISYFLLELQKNVVFSLSLQSESSKRLLLRGDLWTKGLVSEMWQFWLFLKLETTKELRKNVQILISENYRSKCQKKKKRKISVFVLWKLLLHSWFLLNYSDSSIININKIGIVSLLISPKQICKKAVEATWFQEKASKCKEKATQLSLWWQTDTQRVKTELGWKFRINLC